MTFRVADLDIISMPPDSRRSWRCWRYRTDDTLAEVLAPGYFGHRDAPVWRAGDVIDVRAEGGMAGTVVAAPAPAPATPPDPAAVAAPAEAVIPTSEQNQQVSEPPAPDPLLAVRLAGAPKPP